MNNTIIFPNLGLEFNVNPVAFMVGSKEIYWYGVIIACAFLFAGFYATKRTKTFGLTDDDIIDALIIAAPLSIVCARTYYVIFSFDSYRDNFINAFKVWEGGLAIYGGVMGGALGLFIYSKIKGIKFLSILDIGACSLLLGQAIGRWGNFVNAEAYGAETTSFFMMNFGGSVSYHPTFLYESVWNLTGFFVMYLISKHAYKFIGQMSLIYMIWYGLGRGFIEGLRTDSLWWGNFRVSQMLGFATFAFGLIMLIILLKRQKTLNNQGENENDIA